jgi:bifunctional ADP-heptose synthase (sugar kinase/adenylyltransferase)
MDTRIKILTAESARALPGPFIVLTGYFDVLRAAHARDIEAIRSRTGAQTLLALVLPFAGEVFDIHARARMVAALRVVDYVVAVDEPDPGALLAALRPQSVFHIETDELRRNREIADRIRSRQGPEAPQPADALSTE